MMGKATIRWFHGELENYQKLLLNRGSVFIPRRKTNYQISNINVTSVGYSDIVEIPSALFHPITR